jgi:hypothetical protein
MVVFAVASCEKKPLAPAGQTGAAAKTPATGGGAPPPTDQPGEPEPAATGGPKFGTAVISGVVRVEGTVPEPASLASQLAAKAECVQQRQAGGLPELKSELVLVGPDGGLQDAVVVVKKGLNARYQLSDYKEYGHPDPVIDQIGCQYTPHVFIAFKNQPVVVKRTDPFLHNVSIAGIGTNIAMADPTPQAVPFKQARPEKFTCSVHTWMSAWAYVVEHPFVAKTGPDGKFSIQKLPAGKYTIEVWHEPDRKLKPAAAQEIEVKDGETKSDVQFVFQYK